MTKVLRILSCRATTVALSLVLFSLLLTAREGRVSATLQNEKSVETLPYGNEPVDLLEIKFAGENINSGQKVRGDDDWLKHLSLKLKNKSGKRIVYVDVAFDFPETKANGGVTASYSLRLGNRPGAATSPRTPLEVKGGKNLDVSLADEFDKLKRFVERSQPLATLSRVRIRINFIGFDDGTAWSAGSFVKLDPTNPKKYINVNNP